MTKEQLQELSNLFQAVAKGKRIQWRFSDADQLVTITNYEDMPANVRAGYGQYYIAPEPMECWANVYGDRDRTTFHSAKKDADQFAGAHRIRCAYLREVMDDE